MATTKSRGEGGRKRCELPEQRLVRAGRAIMPVDVISGEGLTFRTIFSTERPESHPMRVVTAVLQTSLGRKKDLNLLMVSTPLFHLCTCNNSLAGCLSRTCIKRKMLMYLCIVTWPLQSSLLSLDVSPNGLGCTAPLLATKQLGWTEAHSLRRRAAPSVCYSVFTKGFRERA